MTLMLPIAAKSLARDRHSDMNLILYPRPSFKFRHQNLDSASIVGPIDWEVPDDPLDKVVFLKYLAAKTNLLIQRATEREIPIPPLYAPCLHDYLVMVEGIVRWRGEVKGINNHGEIIRTGDF